MHERYEIAQASEKLAQERLDQLIKSILKMRQRYERRKAAALDELKKQEQLKKSAEAAEAERARQVQQMPSEMFFGLLSTLPRPLRLCALATVRNRA